METRRHLHDWARQALSLACGIRAAPVFERVRRWAHAIPQYELGHLERLARIDARLARLPGLYVRANWRDGISVADCVANAAQFAGQLSD